MRLFLAVFPKYNALNALEEAQEEIRNESPLCRFVPRDKFHLTMAFIGEAGPNILQSAKDALDRLDICAFSANLDGSGRFGDTAVAFLKKEKPLAEFRVAVTDSLDVCGAPYDRRPFTPHVTLARKVPPEVTRPQISALFDIDRLDLVNSETVEGETVYTVLYSKELKHEYVILEKEREEG